MQIETYEIEEINSSEASTMAADSEAIDLIQQLGLEGQKALCNTATATRFPYGRLSHTQEAVFGTLFPRKTAVKEYRDAVIPLRVLQVVAYCRDMPQTAYLEVWHVGSAKEDPILVGRPNQYSSENYLLARWGDSLQPFEELQKKALPLIKAKLATEINRAKIKLDSYSASLDDIVATFINDGQKPSWNVYD